VLGNGCAPARSSSRLADRRLAQPRSRIARGCQEAHGAAQGYGYPAPRVTQVRSVAGLMTQWLLRRTSGEGDIPLTSEPEAEGAADAVRRVVRCRRERVHEPPAAVIAGQLGCGI
jgi:hypothetical protein